MEASEKIEPGVKPGKLVFPWVIDFSGSSSSSLFPPPIWPIEAVIPSMRQTSPSATYVEAFARVIGPAMVTSLSTSPQVNIEKITA